MCSQRNSQALLSPKVAMEGPQDSCQYDFCAQSDPAPSLACDPKQRLQHPKQPVGNPYTPLNATKPHQTGDFLFCASTSASAAAPARFPLGPAATMHGDTNQVPARVPTGTFTGCYTWELPMLGRWPTRFLLGPSCQEVVGKCVASLRNGRSATPSCCKSYVARKWSSALSLRKMRQETDS